LNYEIHLPQFEGPFDLLLFFIQRDELDIYDIPVSEITNEFLEYISQMKELNINVASEFILMAATLMQIKAKMLLPRREMDDHGEEIDPRKELIEKLIEYKKFKEAANQLKKLEIERQKKRVRGNVNSELKRIAGVYAAESDLSKLTLYHLLKAFQQVMDKAAAFKTPAHHVAQYNFTIDDEKSNMLLKFNHSNKLLFADLFADARTKIHAIFIFLALLQLIQSNEVHIKIGLGYNNFWVSKGNNYGKPRAE